MKRLAIVLAFGALLAPVAQAHSRGNHSFGFNALSVGGVPSGDLFLTGSGVYDPTHAAARSAVVPHDDSRFPAGPPTIEETGRRESS